MNEKSRNMCGKREKDNGYKVIKTCIPTFDRKKKGEGEREKIKSPGQTVCVKICEQVQKNESTLECRGVSERRNKTNTVQKVR